MDSPDLDTLLQSFDDKILNICSKLALLDLYQTKNRQECLNTNNILGTIQVMLYDMDQFIQQQEDLLRCQIYRCEKLFTLLNDQSSYIEANLTLINEKPVPVKCKSGIENNKALVLKDDKAKCNLNKKVLSKEVISNKLIKTKAATSIKKSVPTNAMGTSKAKSMKAKNILEEPPKQQNKDSTFSIPEMEPLTKVEIDTIPSYMLGRLTLDVLNEFVAAFNVTIAEKYKFMSSYSTRQTVSEVDSKRFQAYKSHENPETKNVYFCTVNDIKQLSPMKNDPTIRKILLCLRHCKRVKEIRGNPPKLIRYGLVC